MGALPKCSEEEPPLLPIGGGHLVVCHNPR
jgi:hypothetical protein